MAQDHYSEYIGKKYVGLSIVMALIFWACFTRLLLPFVPVDDPSRAYFYAGFTALCLTGVFYIATHMFRLVFQEHRKAQRERAS
jgi:hypothetical protein